MSGNPREHRNNAYLRDRGWWSRTEAAAPSELVSCEQSWQQALRLLDVSRELMKESERLMEETKKSCLQTVQARVGSTEVLAQFWVARSRQP
jgi:hypothetical protein